MVSLEELSEVLGSVSTIAVVGASRNDHKPGHTIPAYLQAQGFTIIPVNPNATELFGEKVYPSLRDVDRQVDMVLVFRVPEAGPAIARDAIGMGVATLWFQPMTSSEEAVDLATSAGLRVVSEACAGVVHRMVARAQVRNGATD